MENWVIPLVVVICEVKSWAPVIYWELKSFVYCCVSKFVVFKLPNSAVASKEPAVAYWELISLDGDLNWARPPEISLVYWEVILSVMYLVSCKLTDPEVIGYSLTEPKLSPAPAVSKVLNWLYSSVWTLFNVFNWER